MLLLLRQLMLMYAKFFCYVSSLLMQVVLGTLLAALVPVVGFNAVMTSEHFASFLVCSISLISAYSLLCTHTHTHSPHHSAKACKFILEFNSIHLPPSSKLCMVQSFYI